MKHLPTTTQVQRLRNGPGCPGSRVNQEDRHFGAKICPVFTGGAQRTLESEAIVSSAFRPPAAPKTRRSTFREDCSQAAYAFYSFEAMDSWGRPSPSPSPSDIYGSGTPTSPTLTTASSKSPTTQKWPYHRQKQSDTNTPFISGEKSSKHHAIPPPAAVANTPAPWQLGRHSNYIPGTGYYQSPPFPTSVQPIFGSAEGDGDENWDPERVQHHLKNIDEAGIRDVEEELHRALQARQVRLHSFLKAKRPGLLA